MKMGIGNSVKSIVIGVSIGIVLSVILVLVGYKLISDSKTRHVKVENSEGQEITIAYVNKKLENISELSTAEMTYRGLLTVIEGNIPLLTQKGFSMIYSATVKAGINPSLIKTEVTDDEIIVTLPPAEIQMSWIDPDSIQFYDEKHAIFNWSKKTDVTEAISVAEKDVKEKGDLDGLVDRASKQAEYVVKGLLAGSEGDRKIIIVHDEETDSQQ